MPWLTHKDPLSGSSMRLTRDTAALLLYEPPRPHRTKLPATAALTALPAACPAGDVNDVCEKLAHTRPAKLLAACCGDGAVLVAPLLIYEPASAQGAGDVGWQVVRRGLLDLEL